MHRPAPPDPGAADESAHLRARVAELEQALSIQAGLADHLAQSQARLAVLAEACRRFALVHANVDALLREIIGYVADTLGPLCVVRLLSPADGPAQAVYGARRSPAEMFGPRPHPPDAGALGALSSIREPLLLPVVTSAALRSHLRPDYAALPEQIGLGSLMAAPLHEGELPIGLISVGRPPSAPAYTPDDLALLQALAEQASLAIVHARAIAAERAGRGLLDTLLATAPVGLGFVDRELRFVRVNASLAEINGLGPEDHIGRSIAEVIPRLAPVLAPIYRQVLETGVAVRDIEIHGTTPAAPDQPRDWLVSYYPVPGADGVAGVGVVVSEITARKQADTALQRQAETLREQAEILNLAHVIIRDLESRIIFWNDGAAQLYGWSRAEAVGQVSHMLFQTRFPTSLAATQAQLYAAGVWEGELVHRRKDGSLLVVASHQVLFRDSAGRPLRILEVNNDITALKGAEKELQRSAERLHTLHLIDRAILTAETPERIAEVVVARLDELVGCDRASVLGYTGEQLQVLAVHDIRPERYPVRTLFPVAPEDLSPPFALEQPWYVPDLNVAPAVAPRAVDYRAYGIRSVLHLPLIAEGHLLGVLRLTAARPRAFSDADIAIAGEVADQLAVAMRSAHLRAELNEEREALARRVAERTAELRIVNAELVRAARMKDEFLANMSHELRTPLNAILGRSELLRELLYGPLTARQDEAIQSIEEAGRDLLTLINDILDLSKVESGMLQLERDLLSVQDLGHAALRLVSQVAVSKQVGLTEVYDPLVDIILADERRLKQILVNLLVNAVKFTPPGGKVGLEVHGDEARQTVTFTVWDTGIGIAPEDQRRLFQPFVQVDSSLSRQQGGTGLGLALVRRLTEIHGGSVILESELGAGSRFHIVLPWLRPTVAEPPSTPAEPERAASSGPIRRALVIDDAPAAAEQMARYLAEIGCEAVIHERAAGALERAAALQPDLIVLDILLPELSGWEVLSQLKADARTAAIPVVVVSVIDDLAENRARGASTALVKPITREAFARALQYVHRAPPDEPPVTASPLRAEDDRQAPRPLVLVADDHVENVIVLTDYLLGAGYDVAVARNGLEAVDQATELRPALILMDIQMPVLDGLEALERIRASGLGDTPVIAVTALAMVSDRERCLAAGADAYLTKPLHLSSLHELIERLLRE